MLNLFSRPESSECISAGSNHLDVLQTRCSATVPWKTPGDAFLTHWLQISPVRTHLSKWRSESSPAPSCQFHCRVVRTQPTLSTHTFVSVNELQAKGDLLFKNTKKFKNVKNGEWKFQHNSLLWFPTDERNQLMEVLHVGLAQAPNIFCRISAFYYFEINVSRSYSLVVQHGVIEMPATCI